MNSGTSEKLIRFLNFAHTMDHMVMLIYPAVVLTLSSEFGRPFGELLPYATGGFIAFGVFSMPFGWIGKQVSGHRLITIFFFGIGLSCVLTGFAQTPLQIGIALTIAGVFAAIYHPIGNSMLSAIDPARVGRIMGRNGLYGNLGVASAALVAGILTDLISWRAAFIVPGVACMIAGAVFWRMVPDMGPLRAPARTGSERVIPRTEIIRVFIILAISTAVGSFIFSATTTIMPKLFEERLVEWTTSLSGVGIFIFFIYMLAAFAQILVGSLVDRHSLAKTFLAVVIFQAPLLLLAGLLDGPATLLAALPMMFMIFGLVPINEVMVARYTSPEYRTRIYSVRYTIGFMSISAAIPVASYFHAAFDGFSELFVLLAGMSVLLTVSALAFMLIGRQENAKAPEPATA